jgi:HEAT repeat protein
MGLTKPEIIKMLANKDISGLIKSLRKNKDWHVRMEAAGAFMLLGDKSAKQDLIRAMNYDKNLDVRYVAAEALGHINDKSVVDDLIHALHMQENLNVKAAIAEALGKIKSTKAIKPLMEVLKFTKSQVETLTLSDMISIRAIPESSINIQRQQRVKDLKNAYTEFEKAVEMALENIRANKK